MHFGAAKLRDDIPRVDNPAMPCHCRTSNARLSSARAEDHVEAPDRDGGEEEPWKPTCAGFRERITKQLDSVRYAITSKDWSDDAREKVRARVKKYVSSHGAEEASMPFETLAEYPDGDALKFRGSMNRDTIVKMVQKYPEEMFKEVQLRTVVYYDQVQLLHEMARNLDKPAWDLRAGEQTKRHNEEDAAKEKELEREDRRRRRECD